MSGEEQDMWQRNGRVGGSEEHCHVGPSHQRADSSALNEQATENI